jgi:DNA repair protein RecN (Recombination protein N)
MFEVEQRMNAISELKLKYGKSISDIMERRTDIAEKLERAEHRDQILDQLMERLLSAKRTYVSKAKALQSSRKQLTGRFTSHVLEELEVLNMAGCKFEVGFVEKRLNDGEYRLSPNGFDDVEFLIATNPGMNVKPLAKIASGGEISRVMLAIKIALSHYDSIKTLIFDEVDTGISGKTAIVVGEKIHQITSEYQVLCITHLPQIAVMADSHFRILKSVDDEFGVTEVVQLSENDQLSEIARMLSGISESNTARQNALEMLEKANSFKNIS